MARRVPKDSSSTACSQNSYPRNNPTMKLLNPFHAVPTRQHRLCVHPVSTHTFLSRFPRAYCFDSSYSACSIQPGILKPIKRNSNSATLQYGLSVTAMLIVNAYSALRAKLQCQYLNEFSTQWSGTYLLATLSCTFSFLSMTSCNVGTLHLQMCRKSEMLSRLQNGEELGIRAQKD